MQIEFGAPVFGVGGKRLGEVDGLVVNAGTKRASAILVDAGLFDRGKHMIGVSAITRSDQDGLHLDEPAATSEAAFADARFGRDIDCPASRTADGVHPRGGSRRASLRRHPCAVPGNTLTKAASSNSPRSTRRWSRSSRTWAKTRSCSASETHAISSDHERLGNVTAFELGDMGLVESITVSEGLIFKERHAFPLTEIDEFGTNAVHLRLTKSAAEATLSARSGMTVTALGNSPAPVLRSIPATRAGLTGARHLQVVRAPQSRRVR